MISIGSKISGKPHFTINILNGNVAVYLSNTRGDTECIKIAVDIIYNLSKILEKNGKSFNEISKDTISTIEEIIRNDLERIDRIKGYLTSSLEEIKEMSIGRIIELLN